MWRGDDEASFEGAHYQLLRPVVVLGEAGSGKTAVVEVGGFVHDERDLPSISGYRNVGAGHPGGIGQHGQVDPLASSQRVAAGQHDHGGRLDQPGAHGSYRAVAAGYGRRGFGETPPSLSERRARWARVRPATTSP